MMRCFAIIAWVFSGCVWTTPMSEQQQPLFPSVSVLLPQGRGGGGVHRGAFWGGLFQGEGTLLSHPVMVVLYCRHPHHAPLRPWKGASVPAVALALILQRLAFGAAHRSHTRMGDAVPGGCPTDQCAPPHQKAVPKINTRVESKSRVRLGLFGFMCVESWASRAWRSGSSLLRPGGYVRRRHEVCDPHPHRQRAGVRLMGGGLRGCG